MENRKHPRLPIERDIAFQVADGPRMAARCRDLSLGGMFIEAGATLPYGTELHVYVHLPDLAGDARIDAIVRWSTPSGMGVQFKSMGARETHGLTELLRTAVMAPTSPMPLTAGAMVVSALRARAPRCSWEVAARRAQACRAVTRRALARRALARHDAHRRASAVAFR